MASAAVSAPVLSPAADWPDRRRAWLFVGLLFLAGICSIIDRLETEPALQYDNVLFVRIEDADSLELADPFLMSSVGRELMTLSSHTIHHFALISMTMRSHGVAMDPDFGMAPSTLRHRETQSLSVAEAA